MCVISVCFKFNCVIRPENVHKLQLETTGCEQLSKYFEAKHNSVEFLLVYYTGHTPEDKQLEKCLEQVRVRRLLCVIDCCHADEVRLIPDLKDCSRAVLRSSERKAKANPMAGSTFTRYFLAGLRSARKCPCDDGSACRHLEEFREKSLDLGVVTLANLFNYTAQHMKEDQTPRKDVISYDNSHFELAFFNKEPIVYSFSFVSGNHQFPDVEVDEQNIDFINASINDITEQLRQEIPRYGVYI